NGRAILFTVNAQAGEHSDAGSVVVARDLKSGAQTIVARGGLQAHYAGSGHVAYGVGGALRVVGFDADRLTVVGSPVLVLDRVVMKGTGAVDFTASRDRTLACRS